MTYDEFKAVWDAMGGFDRIAYIIFDNSMRWRFDRREWKGMTDEDGKQRYDYSDRYGEYLDVREYMELMPDIGCVKMKIYPPGITREQMADPNNKMYWWDVRHVENIQAMFFTDDNNADMRHHWDPYQS